MQRKNGQKEVSVLKPVVIAVAAMLLYEFAQPLIQGRVFDVYDIAASILGGIFIYAVLRLVDYFKG